MTLAPGDEVLIYSRNGERLRIEQCAGGELRLVGRRSAFHIVLPVVREGAMEAGHGEG